MSYRPISPEKVIRLSYMSMLIEVEPKICPAQLGVTETLSNISVVASRGIGRSSFKAFLASS